ncbi:efflux RND transporter periplasmic adaptor subunit [Lichenicola sp.]|uniref:efflux RND transporter periplasmic adaptor subunit n=1 Tax=Lichenicola sp. TaxID=2804529 RepID=UPI003AFFF5B7
MNEIETVGNANHGESGSEAGRPSRGRRVLFGTSGLAMLFAGIGFLALDSVRHPSHAVPAAPPPPSVMVSEPMRQDVSQEVNLLGQFSAVDRVELRAQVGGTLSEIHFKDGQIVHKGDLLFVIDPRPYQIKLASAVASVQTAQARLDLANSEFWRAQQLKHTDFGTAENVDQRSNDVRAATAALATGEQAVRDAQLDLDYSRVTAPFDGRIDDHQISVGSLVSGSRAGANTTTLLATVVSLDPIHLDFDMSENDFLAFQRAHAPGELGETVRFRLGDETRTTHTGTVDFIDNTLDRSSGTIHARAIVPNHDLFLVPGEFARLVIDIGHPTSSLLVPDQSVMLDQSQSIVLTVAPNGTVIPKPVEVGALFKGLRVVQSGLAPTDRVIIDGLMHAMPGTKVTPTASAIHLAADNNRD